MIRGINICFNIRDHRSWVRVRLLSCLYTFVLVIAFIVIMIMLVFGSIIYNHLLNTFAYMGNFLRVIMFILRRRVLIALFVLLILFMTMYSIFPAKKNKFFQMFPGAMLASGAFVGLSELISLYVKYFPNFSYTYGSLTTFILLMLYLYFGMYIIFFCAEINFHFKSWQESVSAKRQRKKAMKYEASIERKQEKYETKKMKKEEKEELKRLMNETQVYQKKRSR